MRTIKIRSLTGINKPRWQYSLGESTMGLGARKEISAPTGVDSKTQGFKGEVNPYRRLKKDTTSPGW